MVANYIADKVVHELEYSDGWIDHIIFDDALILLPNR